MPLHPLARTGYEPLIRALRETLRDSAFGHAITLSGADQQAVRAIALWTAQSRVCSRNTDEPCEECPACTSVRLETQEYLLHLRPSGTAYAVEDVRALRRALQLTGPRRVVVIESAEALRGASANALLKTIEEPFHNVQFILTTVRPHALLATIRSRTMQFQLQRVPHAVARKALGSLGKGESEVERVLRAYPGMLVSAAGTLEDPAALQEVERYDELAQRWVTLPLAQRLREAREQLQEKSSADVQRSTVAALVAAFARTGKVRAHLAQAVHDASVALQTNAQPRFILDALLTRV